MKVVKTYVAPVLVIFLAAGVVVFAALMMARTDWANQFRRGGFRGGPPPQDIAVSDSRTGEMESGRVEQDGFVRERRPPEDGWFLLPFLKVVGLITVGGVLTVLGLWLARFFRRPKPQPSHHPQKT